ncbi:MAG: LacI family DNA-binding transcriptional regulator [Akkermansiaceae bacterium]|nr:LacI family DNA-binding transcriptional regulator [Akkermansiaceae bacterium]NNM29250.1 LacI family DNA-binding transcriptional regulator [Akkermansiaceae bacterium]
MSEVNQQAIADRLGISRATVSRCFTNHAGISPVTRAKVFQVAAEIGYTHMETRAPTTKRPKQRPRFQVLICSDPDEYFHGDYQSPGEQILAGVSEHAQLHGVRTDVNLVPPGVRSLDDPEFSEIEALTKREATGVLLIYPFPQPVIDQLALRFPLVSLVEQLEHTTIDCVDVDHYSGVSSVIDHLVTEGHRRIGFYTRDYPVEASWSFRRYSAFIEKMARLKIEVPPNDIIGMFPHAEAGVPRSIETAAKRTKDGVTAWVCAADHQAYDLVSGLREHGLKVPQDVSVTGFDGIERSGSSPSLTTVEIPFRAIGMTGAERLAARIRNRFAGKQHIYISGKLRPGGTVAPPTP